MPLASLILPDDAFADNPGADVAGFKVRAKSGLPGCEYLSEVPAVKGGTVIMGVITDMLRKEG